MLPRWFTNPLHAHLHHFTEDLPDGANPELPPVSDDIPHAYALLEELFYGVFDSRFINPKPSCKYLTLRTGHSNITTLTLQR